MKRLLLIALIAAPLFAQKPIPGKRAAPVHKGRSSSAAAVPATPPPAPARIFVYAVEAL